MDAAILSLDGLSDQELLKRITELATEEREATALLVAHLAELDARRLHLAEGYSSLFAYCTEVLHLSEYAAYNRIEAARASRRFPVILKFLSEGSLTLATVRLLAPYLTAESSGELLEKARFKSKRVVEELVAEIYPRAAVASVLRRLPVPSLSPETWSHRDVRSDEPCSAATQVPTDLPPHRRAAVVTPLAPQRYKIQFTASAETVENLRRARDLLRHQIPTEISTRSSTERWLPFSKTLPGRRWLQQRILAQADPGAQPPGTSLLMSGELSGYAMGVGARS